MSTTSADELLGRYKQRKQADLLADMTPDQLKAYEGFASTVLGVLDEVEEKASFGMVRRHELNLKYNHMIRKEVFPGGFSAAIIRMQAQGFIDVINLDEKLIVYNMWTINTLQDNVGEGVPISSTIWLRAWINVLSETGRGVSDKMKKTAGLR